MPDRSGRCAAAVDGIRTAFAQAFDACRTLDVVVTNTLKRDPMLLAAWGRDRRVTPKSRVTAAVASPAVSLPEVTAPEPRTALARPVVVPATPAEEPVDVAAFDDADQKAS